MNPEQIVHNIVTGGKNDDGVRMIKEVIAAEREACAMIASHFTVKPDASIYPDIPFDAMNDTAKAVSHMTAQLIAWAIREPEDQP